MPKIKTNKTFSKKFKVSKSGRVKRAQANASHNTGKKSPKRIRQLRKIVGTDSANIPQLKRSLPNHNVKN